MNFKVVIFCLFSISLIGQEFNVQISSDTILAGNTLNVTFLANNVAGQFEGPDMQGLNVISGPNVSTSMAMINGDVTQTATYSYIILCEDIGEITVLPAYLTTNDAVLETEPIQVLIMPNPEGIIERPPSNSGYFEFSFPGTSRKTKESALPKKKKRKLKKL